MPRLSRDSTEEALVDFGLLGLVLDLETLAVNGVGSFLHLRKEVTFMLPAINFINYSFIRWRAQHLSDASRTRVGLSGQHKGIANPNQIASHINIREESLGVSQHLRGLGLLLGVVDFGDCGLLHLH